MVNRRGMDKNEKLRTDSKDINKAKHDGRTIQSWIGLVLTSLELLNYYLTLAMCSDSIFHMLDGMKGV